MKVSIQNTIIQTVKVTDIKKYIHQSMAASIQTLENQDIYSRK
jgi:hypothetical protein